MSADGPVRAARITSGWPPAETGGEVLPSVQPVVRSGEPAASLKRIAVQIKLDGEQPRVGKKKSEGM
jgi:hypothetical protein